MNTNLNNTTSTIGNRLRARISLIISILVLSSCAANAGYRQKEFEPVQRDSTLHQIPAQYGRHDFERSIHNNPKHLDRLWIKKRPHYRQIDNLHQHPSQRDQYTPWWSDKHNKTHHRNSDRHISKPSGHVRNDRKGRYTGQQASDGKHLYLKADVNSSQTYKVSDRTPINRQISDRHTRQGVPARQKKQKQRQWDSHQVDSELHNHRFAGENGHNRKQDKNSRNLRPYVPPFSK